MTEHVSTEKPSPAPPNSSGRHAAGADPAKREQILAGAKSVFMTKGFDAAGVNDICRAAGVSKSTLYVYFENKEDLFESMVEAQRDRLFAGASTALSEPLTTEETLRRYGTALAEILCSDQVLRAHRIVVGIAERMPEIGARFYAAGAMHAQSALADFLRRRVESGDLAIPDVELSAAQFIELATSNLWKPRLFGRETRPPTDTEIARSVTAAVTMFLAAYGVKHGGS
ncbi:TetR/AcrR family transcriptional regulator [Paracoccus albicereus]|nr:TetR/AcrR family transcriptional regulator [Paracoccus albicereus]